MPADLLWPMPDGDRATESNAIHHGYLPAGPFARRTSYILDHLSRGEWREGTISAAQSGLTRDVQVFYATRKTEPVVHDWHGDQTTFCPPLYWDLAIGSGPCGLGCRGCYLLGTFRDRRDPMQPLVYDNLAFLWEAARRWLTSPDRRPGHALGLGTDRSDSLLFEGVLGHVRHLARVFADPGRNPRDCRLLLLTKSANSHYLEGLPARNTVVSFSLNPEPIADLWEGKWPDTLERIAPSIPSRLAASLKAQRLGFEVRWRLDPVLTPPGWEHYYREFLRQVSAAGHCPSRITLGTYRETTRQLHKWQAYWGLPPLEWRPESLKKDGTHWHILTTDRIRIYTTIAALCAEFLPGSNVALCKETHSVRRQSGLCSSKCNCLA
jgi:DNA repair photolyase